MRIRAAGGPGGHNGVRSVLERLGTGQASARAPRGAGSGRTDEDLADYVLRAFDASEEDLAKALIELGALAVTGLLADGVAVAMNRLNGRRADPLAAP